MTAAALLEELRARGVELSVEGDRLGVRAPRGALTDDHRARLTELKPDLIALLRPRVSDPGLRFEPFPLTDIQQAYWVGRGSELDLGGVGCFAYREFDGLNLDPARLEAAWQCVIDRHDMIRAIVLPDGRQKVLPDVPPYRFTVVDLRGRPDAETDAELERLRRELAQRVLPADRWPLFDIRLTLRDGGRVRVHFGIDLLIADAAGLFQLLREWGRFYREPDWNPPGPSRSFRDFVLEAESRRSTAAYQASEAYWRERLNDLPPSPPLPLLSSAGTAPRFVRRSVRLSPDVWAAFREQCAKMVFTPSAALAAAYADVLARWSDAPRFTLAVTLFDRPPELAEVVGDFTTTVLLEADTTAETFAERGRALHRRLTADMEHRAVSGVRVLRERNRQRSGGSPDLMPVAFTSGLGHRGPSPSAWLGEPAYSLTQTPQLALDHIAVEENGELLAAWDAREEVFPPGLLDAMFEAYSDWLRRLATDPEAWTAPLRPDLPKSQREQLAAISNTAAPLPEGLLQDRFFECARERPDAPAVITPERTLTYGDLSRAAEEWGERLRELGAEPDTLVAVVLPKGWEQAVAAFGVLCSGAAYLPIDPDWPTERRHRLLSLGRVRFVLTSAKLDSKLEWPADVRRLCISGTAPSPTSSSRRVRPASRRA